jgi:hypothetical protein
MGEGKLSKAIHVYEHFEGEKPNRTAYGDHDPRWKEHASLLRQAGMRVVALGSESGACAIHFAPRGEA